MVAVTAQQNDTQFLYRQQNPLRVQALQVEASVTKAPEPVPGRVRPRAVAARCQPGSRGELRNPWRCVVRYASRNRIRYRLTIRSSGGFYAVDRTGQRVVRGCCIGVENPG